MMQPTSTPPLDAPLARGHILVIGNEKGGSGKTTTSMHLIVSLLRLGFKVGSMDIDARQRSLSRYIENRKSTMEAESTTLPLPAHVVINRSPFATTAEAEADERERFTRALARLLANCDFVVIDSPGSDTYLSRLAHSYADTVITPVNDSFVDLDVLASVDGISMKIVKPSIYSEMLWEQKLQRAKRDGGTIDWVVMRNRLSNIDARNKRMITKVMEDLTRRLGFRVAPGFSERVIFRELFLLGLTVLDVVETNKAGTLSMSHLAARQEVRDLLKSLRIPVIDERIAQVRTGNRGDVLTDPRIAPVAKAKAPADIPAHPPESSPHAAHAAATNPVAA
ncbi:MAG: division plane positioning ATPase MipZ [Alphaproteobacteria bacterium]|nr:division plane positioning ATPase MipZ [Alphaproteobacteria bacterium]